MSRPTEIDEIVLGRSLDGQLVRFAHERNGGPVHKVVAVASDGMVELNDMGGWFAPHLFSMADDIADIPPKRRIGVDRGCYDLARHFLTDRDLDTDDLPSNSQIASDLQSLSEAIQQVVENWFSDNPWPPSAPEVSP